jgi:hypothetical protein
MAEVHQGRYELTNTNCGADSDNTKADTSTVSQTHAESDTKAHDSQECADCERLFHEG